MEKIFLKWTFVLISFVFLPLLYFPQTPSMTSDLSTPSTGPFKFELSLQENNLQAFLTNTSSQEQTYLYNTQLQPSRLLIQDKDHRIIQSFDRRSMMKFDNTPYRELYKTIAPQARVLLQTARLEKKENTLYLLWEPFEYELSAADGPYSFALEWQSLGSKAYSSETKQSEELQLWKGTLTSNTVHLP
jgi:hypothetical protein